MDDDESTVGLLANFLQSIHDCKLVKWFINRTVNKPDVTILPCLFFQYPVGAEGVSSRASPVANHPRYPAAFINSARSTSGCRTIQPRSRLSYQALVFSRRPWSCLVILELCRYWYKQHKDHFDFKMRFVVFFPFSNCVWWFSIHMWPKLGPGVFCFRSSIPEAERLVFFFFFFQVSCQSFSRFTSEACARLSAALVERCFWENEDILPRSVNAT